MENQKPIQEETADILLEEKPTHSTCTRVLAFVGAVVMLGVTVLIIYLLGGGTI